MWEPLRGDATWKSPPLFNFQTPRSTLIAQFGLPHAVDLDSNGLGPFDAWAVRFSCGLEVCIWLFALRIDGSRIDNLDEPAIAEVHANERDLEHLVFHVARSAGDVWKWHPETTVDAAKEWTLVRQDDHGNRNAVRAFTSRCEAEAEARAFEERGHKQLYWVERAAGMST